MYNSTTVRFLVGLWNKLELAYEYSMLAKFIGLLSRGLGFLFHGSLVGSFFIDDSRSLEATGLYRGYLKILDLFNRILEALNKLGSFLVDHSRFGALLGSSFGSREGLFKFISLLTGFSCLGIGLGQALIYKNFRGSSLALLGLGLFLILLARFGRAFFLALDRSSFFTWLGSLFSLEEGDDQWW